MAFQGLLANAMAEYVGGNTTAISQPLLDLARANPGLVRITAEQGAHAVALYYCRHATTPEVMPDYDTLAEARQVAGAHPGLCGVQHSALIAAVRVQDVLDRGQEATATKLRNQMSVVCIRAVTPCCWLYVRTLVLLYW